jgi:deoxyribodipyrimidine photo-lyase
LLRCVLSPLTFVIFLFLTHCRPVPPQVDAHNVCPVRKVSSKCEFAAKTIRSKIHGLVSEYLTEFPAVQVMTTSPHPWTAPDIPRQTETRSDVGVGSNLEIWSEMTDYIRDVDLTVPEVTWLESGEQAAMASLNEFLGVHLDGYSASNRQKSRLDNYAELRNDPSISNGCSGLSPYLHFGQLSSQRICLEVCLFLSFFDSSYYIPSSLLSSPRSLNE